MSSRNVPILSSALALNFSGGSIMALVGGIIGIKLAPTPALSTLLISLVVLGTAIFVLPASMVMRRIGRKRSFMLATFMAVIGALLAIYALGKQSFALFSFSSLFVGLNAAFVQQYRFAAAESVEKAKAPRAISYVLFGGIVAGFLGPEIAKRTQNMPGLEQYVGSFIALAIINALVIVLLSFMKDVAPPKEEKRQGGREMGAIVKQPNFLIAVMAGAAAYGVMAFIMTATPLQMNTLSSFNFADTAWVIQSHIIAMFLPSLITGRLIERFGLSKTMMAGALLLLASTSLAIYDKQLVHYWGALVLLGLGWNLLFVGGSVLLTHTYRPEERFKAQAANDFLIFGIRAMASLSAGSVLFFSGWDRMNLLSFSVVLIALVLILIQRNRLPQAKAQHAKA
jgi:MFS family permease